MKKKLSTDEMVQKLLAGDRRSAARLITLVEDEMDEHHEVISQLDPRADLDLHGVSIHSPAGSTRPYIVKAPGLSGNWGP